MAPGAGPAAAQQADDRCTGTFCDWYYGGPPPAQPAGPKPAATPLTVPSGNFLGNLISGGAPAQPQAGGTAAPAKRPLVAVQGGGILGMVRGEKTDRCSGTFCDLYYGGPPPEKPQTPDQPAGSPDQAGAPPDQAAAEPDPAPQPELVERREPERCAAPASDPWKCYR
jgi:hypothetical protein